ncbi:DUF1801 domain-containing protein [Temperatibacter marinus]|uniref:DUF1801 domain-containing protein n=1 Tax=Temperatibacter marinus TaxID=1456591 RepID=A0AA52EDR9_9PROT|nr:DUF1801 domain-containing protein [Temperatibacter marinus]WND02850.1 DUF1801 domain-containing protein [Temperatibacter marinus]
MSKNDNQTQKNDADVLTFIEGLENKRRREDSLKLLPLFERITGQPATMWGDSIVGFGSYHYKYASGREGDWCLTGFSPRKANTTLYIMNGFSDYKDQLSHLGKHKHSKSCLYINKLEDVDLEVIEEMIADSTAYMRSKYASE